MNTKQSIILWAILATMVVIVILLVMLLIDKDSGKSTTSSATLGVEMMDLTLYVQDKEVAKVSDCSVTKKIVVQAPKTLTVADASLRILFEDELYKYGFYNSVVINDGLARIILDNENTRAGNPVSSLSSCESGHLMSVLKNTLMQYNNVLEVQLESPKGVIQF
jgi:hypothetical protein